MRPRSKLTHTFVKSIAVPGRYGDGRGGNGLSLLVKKTADGHRWSKTWSQRLRIHGELITRGLGSFPLVTLAEAREICLDRARRGAHGEDIFKPAEPIPTVADAFEAVIQQRSRSWKSTTTEKHWRASLQFSKRISSKPISAVRPKDVLSVIEPLWYEKPKTARDLRGHLSSVMEWAMTAGYLSGNPAAPGVTRSLGKQPTPVSHRSIDHSLLGGALATVRDSNAWWATKYCLIFLALTAVRSREAREAKWDEIDLESSTWTIPAERMKGNREHKVPLSTQALALLADARGRSDGSHETIFPPQRGQGEFMDSKRLSELLDALAIPAVPHGFRACFSNWAGEQSDISEPVSEMVLAHTPGKAVVKAYRTSTFLDQRRPLMQKWSDYLHETIGPFISTPQAKEPIRKDPSKAKAAGWKKKTGGDTSANKGEPKVAPQPANRADRRVSQTRSQLNRRSDRIAQRICVDAGSDNHGAAPGKTRCEDCAEIHRVGRRKSDAARREGKKSALALSRAMDKDTAAAQ